MNMMLKNSLPLWRSHKIVRAAEIASVTWDAMGANITFADVNLPTALLPMSIFNRYKPGSGDFLVMYDDDYLSVSPRKAFIEGYTRIEGPEPNDVAAQGMSTFYAIMIGAVAVLTWEGAVYLAYKMVF